MAKTTAISDTNLSKAIVDLLIDIPIFDTLTSDELRVISRHMNFMDFKQRETIFKEGEKGDFVCFITKGSLDIIKKNETGKDVIIATLGKGRSIGEMSIIDTFPRSATVKARTETTLVILTRKGFDNLIDEHSKIGVKILKGLAKLLSMNMRKTSSKLADYMLPLG